MTEVVKGTGVGTIFAALAKAQASIQNPIKNASNPHFKSRYSTLDEGLNVARDALSAVGIAIFQRTYVIDNLLMLETVLGHESGESLSSHYPVIAIPYKPQDGMSCLTYARRAALFAAVGIAGEDDDGNTAQKATTIEHKPKVDTKASTDLLTKMKADLVQCKTTEDLGIWTAVNRENKAKLSISDQAIIVREYKNVAETLNSQESVNG